MVEDFKTQMYNLTLELKEKHRLQRRHLLTVIKRNRKCKYKQRETGSIHSEQEVNRQENFREQSPNPSLLRRFSFHIAEEKGESKA